MAKKVKRVVKVSKKRNPQDATLRNIRALKSRVSRLEVQLADAQKRLSELWVLAPQVTNATGMVMGTGETVDGN